MFNQDLLISSPLNGEKQCREVTPKGLLLHQGGDQGIGSVQTEGEEKNYVDFWQMWPVGQQGILAGVRAGEKSASGEERGQTGKILKLTVDGNGGSQGRLTRVFCCRAEDEAGGLTLGEQWEKRGSASSLSSFLAGVACGLAGGACWG